MSQFVEVKTSELIGSALDWAVATVEAMPVKHDPMGFGRTENGGFWVWGDSMSGPMLKIGSTSKLGYSPSTSWEHGGPLIERELIEVSPRWHNQHCAVNQDWEKRGFKADHGWHWVAYVLGADNIDDNHEQEGGTPLVAAMRCIVSIKLGDVVQVPAELVGGEA